MPNQVRPDDGEYRIVVCGKAGSGKSTICNALLGKDQFSAGSTTQTSEVAQETKNGITIKVIDTPDMTTAGMKQKEKRAEVGRWKQLSAPGAHLLLLVIRGDVPYTEEDFIVYRQLRRFWGRGSVKERLLVAFTFCQGQEVADVGEKAENESPKWMGKVFRDCGGRYIVFKGKNSGNLLDEAMDDDDDDDSEDEDDGEEGKGKGGRKRRGSGGSQGSGKGERKGSAGSHGSGKGKRRGSAGSHGGGKGRKGKKGRGKGRGKEKGNARPKGGRGRRYGHGQGKGGGGFSIFSCICALC